jgi:FixJ family two-component response regulator
MSGRPVYLVDEDSASRRYLIERLSALGIEAWPFASHHQFATMIGRLEPGCVLIGGDMSGESGLDAMAALNAEGLGWPVVIAASRSCLRVALAAMKLGAVDFLEQPVGERQLADALGEARERLEAGLSAETARRDALARLARLTPREMEVAGALASGMSNKIVAHRLGISVRTAEMHRARILRKLGLRRVPEIVGLLALADTGKPLTLAPLPRARERRSAA